jgi:hypothetical protein
MKRLNPATGVLFKQGCVREDGFVFLGYNLKDIKRNGEFQERWVSPAVFEKHKESTKRWKENNPERVKENRKRRYENNVEQSNENSKRWFEENRERHKELVKRWRETNPDKANAIDAKRRSAKLQRTPPWLTKEQLLEIQSFYTKAKDLQTLTGIEFHVDHIIPLQGKLVSGLHVPWNLRVIPAVENLKKSNNYEPTFENATADVT